MRKLFYILGFLFSIHLTAQEPELTFPDSFLGIYKGDLEISSKRGNQKIPMEFHLTKTDKDSIYNYVLIYNKVPRNYLLKVVDKDKGVFNIDENNGIILQASFHKNVLHSFFEVQRNFLSTRLEFKNDSVAFEILFTNLKNKITTGGISKDIPEVFGYPITVFQKAILTKD